MRDLLDSLQLDWALLSKKRGEIYGLSILSIIVFHYFEGVSKSDAIGVLRLVARLFNSLIGSVGVDAFVLLSGFGIYHSLHKGPPVLEFYKRRAHRVLLPYLISGFVFWAIKDVCILRYSLLRMLYDYSTLSFWIDGVRTVWYVSFIFIMYLIAPLVKHSFDHGCPLLLWVTGWIAWCAVLSIVAPEWFGGVEVALLRAPWFFVGMGCGRMAVHNPRIPSQLVKVLPLSISFKLVAGLANLPLSRVFNGFYAGFLIVLFLIAEKSLQEGESSCSRELRTIGQYSYELYLTHVMLRNLAGTLGIGLVSPIRYTLCIMASVPLAILLAYFSGSVGRAAPTKRL